jgi:hypothetical protein
MGSVFSVSTHHARYTRCLDKFAYVFIKAITTLRPPGRSASENIFPKGRSRKGLFQKCVENVAGQGCRTDSNHFVRERLPAAGF